MNKRGFTLVLFVVISLLALSGCTFFNPLPNPNNQKGSVKVQIEVPDQFLNGSQQFVTHTLALKEIVITVKKGIEVYNKTLLVNENVEAMFDSLTAGTWQIEVLAKDMEGFIVYTGNSSGDVVANTTTTVNVNLTLQKGNLDFSMNLPANLSIVSGEVYLTNPADNLEPLHKPLLISGITASASFTDLQSTTWHMVANLYDADGIEVARAEAPLDVLPGRTMSATATPGLQGGELEITVGWELPPLPPQSCGANLVGSSVVVSWEMSPSLDITGYMVYRATSESGPKQYATLSLLQAYQYIDSDIKEGMTYWYWVQAYDSKGLCSDLTSAQPVYVGDRSRILMEWHDDQGIDIAVMELDGSNIMRLTSAPGQETQASWSKDGLHILYQSYEPGNSEIYVKDLATGAEINLTNTPDLMEYNPSYSSDGTKIIFDRVENGYGDIFLMNVDGTGVINLTNTPDEYEGFPSISPDGTQVVFSRSGTGDWRVYTMNIDGSNIQQLPLALGVRGTVWSPDSSKIVVEGEVLDANNLPTGTSEAWVIDRNGTNPVKLISYRSDPCKPSWSPDSQKITLGCDDDFNYQWDLFVVNANGTGLTKLPETCDFVEAPVYSRDGSKIYFGGSVAGDVTIDICGIHADGTEFVNLTPDTLGFNLRFPKRSWF